MKALFVLFAVAVAVSASVSTAALASDADADLLRCRALADASAKLACYDAITVTAPATAAARPAAAAAPAPLQTATTATATVTTVATTTAAAAVTTTAATAQDATFGLTARQIRKPDENDGVDSTLVGAFNGWNQHTTFRLANGQVWHVVDDSEASLYAREAPKVTIKRNFLGNFFLEVEGVNQAPRVRRVE